MTPPAIAPARVLGALEAHVIDTEHQPRGDIAQMLASRLADGSLDLTGD
jgi:hypothetical protein